MLPFVVGAVVVLAAALLSPVVARLAGLGAGPFRAGSRGIRGADALRVFAGATALVLLVGGTGGDVLVAGALAAAAVGRRAPAASLALIFVSAVPALRAGSSAVDDVAGAHSVLGPAALSPSVGVASAAVLAASAALVTAVVLVPQSTRGGPRTALRSPGAIADALAAPLALLLGVVAAAGTPVISGESAVWLGGRLAILAAALIVAAVARRLTRRMRPGYIAAATTVAAAASVAVALGSR